MTEASRFGGPVKPEDSLPLLPCPFCGSASIDHWGWTSREDHGPACDDCGGSAATEALWNSRPVWSTPLASLGDSRSERVARLAQQKLPLCNDGWELE